ncbi:transferase, chloramphenicol acetyltransferase-like domain protein [Tanacetum coccineum]
MVTEGASMEALYELIRSQKGFRSEAAPFFHKAMKLYEGLAKQLVHRGYVRDVFARAFDRAGVAALKVAIEKSRVLFFHANRDKNLQFVTKLEKSLERTLTRFYPLAGRYVEENHSVDCSNQGAEYIYAKVNIKLQDILVLKENVMFFNEFIPSKLGVAYHLDNSLLATPK